MIAAKREEAEQTDLPDHVLDRVVRLLLDAEREAVDEQKARA